MINWIKKFYKNDLSEEEREQKKRIQTYSKNVYNSIADLTKFSPIDFERNALEITNHLMSHKGAIVTFKNMDSKGYHRLLDFISGAIYCLGGNIDKLGEKLFLITPASWNYSDSSENNSSTKSKPTFYSKRSLEGGTENTESSYKELQNDGQELIDDSL